MVSVILTPRSATLVYFLFLLYIYIYRRLIKTDIFNGPTYSMVNNNFSAFGLCTLKYTWKMLHLRQKCLNIMLDFFSLLVSCVCVVFFSLRIISNMISFANKKPLICYVYRDSFGLFPTFYFENNAEKNSDLNREKSE